MGVYIKGIEKPKTCGTCRFNYFQEDECSWYSCSLLPRDVDQGSSGGFRQPDCPLVEVPEPHGRLIDENELGELIHRMWVAKQLTNTKYNTFNDLLDIAKPVIEAEE